AQPGTPKEVVVSREFVRRFFPSEDPLGRYIDLGWRENGDRRGGTIIGVVGDVKQGALDQETPPLLYLPYAQAPQPSLRVGQRTHELGVRVALGATGQRIAAMVVSQGLSLTIGGALVGVVAAVLVTRVLSALLFGVSALDPLTFAVVLFVLIVVATVASYVP